jgi:tRNA/tmRNA/rRNA uracil-C5-methylase (TrmA/RlmC/RlmD family)
VEGARRGAHQGAQLPVVADLGAGEGTLAQLLAQRAEKVIAVDLSPKMVEFGQALAIQNGLTNLEYRLGDIEDPPIDDSNRSISPSSARRCTTPSTRSGRSTPRSASSNPAAA